MDIKYRLKLKIYEFKMRKQLKKLKNDHGRSWDKDMADLNNNYIDISVMTHSDYMEIDIEDMKLELSFKKCALLRYILNKIY